MFPVTAVIAPTEARPMNASTYLAIIAEHHRQRSVVRLQGEWIDVPADTVITEPNRAGRTIVWPYYINGRALVRCFMPGSMT